MKALVIAKTTDVSTAADLVFKDLPIPEPDASEALIKVQLAGICRTDQELVKGYMNFSGVPGHEFIGEVVSVKNPANKNASALIGQRVVGEINCGCGHCEWCAAGRERHCPQRTVLGIAGRNGAFAEYLTLPVKNLHRVPDDMDDRTAVFTEPVAAALEIFAQVKVKPAQRAVVIGDGKLGLLTARLLQIHGCDVTCVGGAESKLLILRKWGIHAVHRSRFQPEPYDIAVEASGSPDGFSAALKSLRPRGTLILKSTYAGTLNLDTAPIVINEITVVGSRCGRFPPALRILQTGLLPVKDLITRVYPFNDVLSAFTRAGEPDALKILLDFS